MSASVALAFGGSRDIGAAIALRLAKGDFDVALTYLSRPDQAIDTVSALVQRTHPTLIVHGNKDIVVMNTIGCY